MGRIEARRRSSVVGALMMHDIYQVPTLCIREFSCFLGGSPCSVLVKRGGYEEVRSYNIINPHSILLMETRQGKKDVG